MVVMAAATSTITEASPFIVRTSFTLPQATVRIADWAAKNRIKKVVTLVSRLRPGHRRRERTSPSRFTAATAARSLDEAARAAAQPRFRAVPAEGARRQARRAVRVRALGRGRGLHEAVRRARARQGRHPPDRHRRRDRRRHLNDMGDVALGVVTSHHYSAAHKSPANKKFVEAFKKANNGMRPNFMAVGGYDGMRVIYEALKATKGARRRGAARRDEGPDRSRARAARSRSTRRRATSCRTSTSARSSRSAASSTTSSSTRPKA